MGDACLECCETLCCNNCEWSCCNSCGSLCCCCEDEDHPKTKEEEKKEHRRFQTYLRLIVYSGYAFAFVSVLTQPHYLWENRLLFLTFWILYFGSLACYEWLRLANPGFVPPDKVAKYPTAMRKKEKLGNSYTESNQTGDKSTLDHNHTKTSTNSLPSTYHNSVKNRPLPPSPSSVSPSSSSRTIDHHSSSTASSFSSSSLPLTATTIKNRNNGNNGSLHQESCSSMMINNDCEQDKCQEEQYNIKILNFDENINLVSRYRYCKYCEKNVAKYDHHCVWIGTCVGEKNHFIFVLFLFLECIFLVFCFFVACTAVFKIHTDLSILSNWKKAVISMSIAWIACIISVLGIFMPGALFCHHLYLVATNQTSYEIYKPKKLDYLRDVAENAAKFDEGLWTNCYKFCVYQNPCFRKCLRSVKTPDEFVKWNFSTETTESLIRNCDCDECCDRCMNCECCGCLETFCENQSNNSSTSSFFPCCCCCC